MREKVTRILLKRLEKHTPSRIKSIQLQILLNTTAEAFRQQEKSENTRAAAFGQQEMSENTRAAAFGQQVKMPPCPRIWHLPAEEALAAYAAYTTACLSNLSNLSDQSNLSHRTVQSDPSASVIDRKRVLQCAYRLGRKIRKMTGFSKKEDLERLVFYLYSNIGIKMTGHLPGEIIIPVCYFSKVYTPEQCMTMSLMDWGIISGICGGGKLVFTERLTQGCGRCRAHLSKKRAE